MKALEWSQHSPSINLWEISRQSRAANSTDPSPILPNFKPIQDFIAVIVICKNEDDPNENEGARGLTSLHIDYCRCSRAANSVVGDGNWQKFKLIQAFMVGIATCKNNEDPSKMKSLKWSQHFSHYKSMGSFPDIQGQLTPWTLVQNCRISNPSKIL